MRKLFMGVIAALLVVPAFADVDGGDTETAQSTLTVDIQSAVTVTVASLGTITLDEGEVEGGLADTATAAVTVRSNDEATLKIESGNLVDDGGESDNGPIATPGVYPATPATTDPALLYDLTFTPADDSAAWGAKADDEQTYASGVTGHALAQGSDTGGTLKAYVRVNPTRWEDAIAGGYSATVTLTLTAAPGL